jgi:hypothetical protein
MVQPDRACRNNSDVPEEEEEEEEEEKAATSKKPTPPKGLRVKFRRAVWGGANGGLKEGEQGSWDVVFGSDLAFSDQGCRALVRTVDAALSRSHETSSRFVLSFVHRSPYLEGTQSRPLPLSLPL